MGKRRLDIRLTLKIERLIKTRGREDFRHRPIVAENVDDEGLSDLLADALGRKKIAHIEQIPGMLAIERGDELTGVKISEADDLDFGEAEPLFDPRRDRPPFRFIDAALRDLVQQFEDGAFRSGDYKRPRPVPLGLQCEADLGRRQR
jgi:hypothetical protein